jgi:hypothetical protein
MPASAREAHVREVRGHARDPRLGALFLRRPVIERILAEVQASGVDTTIEQQRAISMRPERPRSTPPGREPS